MSALPHSYSKIKIWKQCELRYDYQYVAATHKDVGKQGNYGKDVHEGFEDYCVEGKELSPHLIQFKGILDRLKARSGEKHYEMEIAVREDKSICGWWDKDCWMRGIVDWAVLNDDRCVAGDWKTGKPSDDVLQMKLMAALLFERFPLVNQVTTSYFWLYHPTAPSTPIVYTRDMLQDLWGHFEVQDTKISFAVSAGVFQPKPSGLCPWCPAYDVCTYAKRRRR